MPKIALFLITLAVFLAYPPAALDTRLIFAALNPIQPYATPGYINPPWVALVPFWMFPPGVAVALCSALTMTCLLALAHDRGARLPGLVLLATSFPILSAIQNGAVEFVPALGLLIGGEFGTILLLGKPQSGAGVLLRWRWTIPQVVTVAGLLALSLVAWPGWPGLMLRNVAAWPIGLWNASPWPWGIPLGLALLAFGRGELSAAWATVLLVPYLAPHSLAVPMALLCARSPRWAAVVWVGMWMIVIARSIYV